MASMMNGPATRRNPTGKSTDPSLAFRRSDLKKIFSELDRRERNAAERRRRRQAKDPAYRALWRDPRWKALMAESKKAMAGHRPKVFRLAEEYTAEELAAARAASDQRDATFHGFLQRAAAIMGDYELPKADPIDTPELLLAEIERRLVSARMVRHVALDGGDETADALALLREFEPQAAKMIGGTALPVSTGDPVRDLHRLIATLKPGRRRHVPSGTAHRPVQRVRPTPLTAEQKAVWDKLNGRAMTAKQLAKEILGSESDADVMRKRIERIRKGGRKIKNRGRIGFYRPDQPPPA